MNIGVKLGRSFGRRLSSSGKALALMSVALLATPVASHAALSQVTGGSTSVVFGNGALDALGLEITAVNGVIAPGGLGPNSVAFDINSRDAASGLSTTLTYDADDFAPFNGTIEHSGTLQFNGAIDVGNFTIGFAGDRPDGASGFFVASTFGLEAILFDIANPVVEPFEDFLIIGADILVSPELAMALGNDAFAGVDAGAALVLADATVVPVPAAAWLFGSGLIGLVGMTRRKQS